MLTTKSFCCFVPDVIDNVKEEPKRSCPSKFGSVAPRCYSAFLRVAWL